MMNIRLAVLLYLSGLLFLFSCNRRAQHSPPQRVEENDTVKLVIPHYSLDKESDLDVLMDQIGDARVVLLGEASHGTAEYYNWRAALSRRLIQEKGFDFIAVEGEWADSYRVNNFIKGPRHDSAAVIQLLQQYNRWPTWMWGNYEVGSLVHWLNGYNQGKKEENKIGFYGLDVYCLWESMTELMPYIGESDPAIQTAAQKVQSCFQPYSSDAYKYAVAVRDASAHCGGETQRLWQSLQRVTGAENPKTERHFVMQQNALVAFNAENYYRTMVYDDAESWNIRDRHMAQTLKRLMNLYGRGAKAIVWEHNTHVGDARYTDMAQARQTNVGELVRKEFGEQNVFIVGFGSYEGTVIAAEAWGADIKKMNVPPAIAGSWENILHTLGASNKLILSKDIRNQRPLNQWIGHRAIGVVYHPERERNGNYVPSIIPRRYDAFMYFDKTTALHPIANVVNDKEPPDTYPWGY
jgi:erythromycin esterase-like protein